MTPTPCAPPNLPARAVWYALVGGETLDTAEARFRAKYGDPKRCWSWGIYVMFEREDEGHHKLMTNVTSNSLDCFIEGV